MSRIYQLIKYKLETEPNKTFAVFCRNPYTAQEDWRNANLHFFPLTPSDKFRGLNVDAILVEGHINDFIHSKLLNEQLVPVLARVENSKLVKELDAIRWILPKEICFTESGTALTYKFQ